MRELLTRLQNWLLNLWRDPVAFGALLFTIGGGIVTGVVKVPDGLGTLETPSLAWMGIHTVGELIYWMGGAMMAGSKLIGHGDRNPTGTDALAAQSTDILKLVAETKAQRGGSL